MISNFFCPQMFDQTERKFKWPKNKFQVCKEGFGLDYNDKTAKSPMMTLAYCWFWIIVRARSAARTTGVIMNYKLSLVLHFFFIVNRKYLVHETKYLEDFELNLFVAFFFIL